MISGLGIDINNPGNLKKSRVRYLGEVDSRNPKFKAFSEMRYGYRAAFVALYTYQVRYSLNTIRNMLPRYAPDFENDTAGYIRSIKKMTGLDPDEPIDTKKEGQMVPLVAAISKMENGVDADMSAVRDGWKLFIDTIDEI
ncbi:MAG: structural protein P5 [Spirochaetia bacterium]|nr:structural protein P5 [Spirochaetia bacterium]